MPGVLPKRDVICRFTACGVFLVGSVNPAENFRVLVRQKKATFEEGKRYAVGFALKERCSVRCD